MNHCGEDDIAVFFTYLFLVKVTNRSHNMWHFFFIIFTARSPPPPPTPSATREASAGKMGTMGEKCPVNFTVK
jgi:hypothetical protein